MIVTQILEKVRPQKIGKEPVVVLPLKVWRYIEHELEDIEMQNSKALRGKIAKARKEKKQYSFIEVKKLLKL